MDETMCHLICLIILICVGYGGCQSNAGNFCGSQKIPCDDDRCIKREKWCNGRKDCDDRSDEAYCKTHGWFKNVNHTCTSRHFQCENGQCVPIVTVCDDYYNCKDHSDEKNCGRTTTEMPLTSENTNIEAELDRNTDEDIDPPITETNETSFPESQEISRAPATMLIPQSTTDYYSNRIMRESKNQHTDRSQGNVRYDNHQRSYPQQPKQYPTAPYVTNSRTPRNGHNSYHTRTHQDLYPYNRHSDTVPTASFPSNLQHESTPSFSYRPENVGRDYSDLYPVYPPASSSHDIRGYTHEYCSQYVQEGNLDPATSNHQKTLLPPFNFRINITHRLGNRYRKTIQKAESWLTGKRDHSYGWGKDTPRALVALSLINNSFLSSVPENSLMKKSLQRHLGIKLLTELKSDRLDRYGRNSIKLAQYINALLATCQDPRNFMGKDLVQRLWSMKNEEISRNGFVNPFIYITLCLVNAPVTERDVDILNHLLPPEHSDEPSRDKQILATTALACFQHNNPGLRLNRQVDDAINALQRRELSDKSFGSVYSTGLVAQAIMSGNNTWNPTQTLDFLKQNQSDDGSFGDMMATYYILPALSGRSLLHLRNTQCEPPPDQTEDTSSILDIVNEPGPKIKVYYTVKIGYPPTYTLPAYVPVRPCSSFFDIMRAIGLLQPAFNFRYKVIPPDGKIDVHTISNIPNDAERGFFWHLYTNGNLITSDPRHIPEYTGDIRQLYPADGQELVYWYF